MPPADNLVHDDTGREDRRRDRTIEEYAVLAAPPRRELLALAELAAKVSHVPMATINLLTTNHQWQVATYGFDAGICARRDSMCTVVAEESRPILVADARLDERFKDNPFTTGELAEVRFYAAHPLVTPDGVVFGTLCVFDVNAHPVEPELRETLATLAERVVDVLELELTSRRLAAANERLAAFAGQVSHDLKNPLATVRMSVEMAGDEAGDDDRGALATLLQRAERGALRMESMIDDLLTFAAAGGHGPRHAVDLDDVAAEVVEDLAGAVAPGQLTVDRLPTVRGDHSQLRVLLQNLVANAVKFSPPAAPVLVRAEPTGRGWRVEVVDGGRGVPPEERARVFEPLVRLGADVAGTGIGLATCRRIVESHGGRIGIDGRDGPGAIVWFELPAS